MTRLLTLLCLVGLPLTLQAQDWEFGVIAGGANYNGELAPVEPVVLKETGGMVGGLVRYNLSQRISLKSAITYGQISGDDANYNSRYKRQRRNLSFRSDIFEVSLQAEVNFMKFDPTERNKKTAIYGLTGLALFNFNPQAQFQDEWVDLQPLGTEGQGTAAFPDREKYSLTQVSIPIGIGVKHALSENVNIGAEFGFRKTFTDYLDDVSKTYAPQETLVSRYGEISYRLSNRTWETLEEPAEYDGDQRRGNPDTKDWYYFGGLTLTYTITDQRCPGF